MKNLKLTLSVVMAALLVAPAFATDPTFTDVTTAASSGTLTFLSANSAALFGILLLSVGFKLAWKVIRGIGR